MTTKRAPLAEPEASPGPVADRRTRAWSRLTREIEACHSCPLSASRRHVVVFRGSLSARVLLVGEAPGADEDRTGIPFVGRSGRRLDAGLASAGISPERVAILNLIKCRPK